MALRKLVNGIISDEQYTCFINLDSQSTTKIKNQLRTNELLIKKLNTPTVLQSLEQIVSQKHINTLTPTIVNLFIEKIEVQDSEHICIHYKFNQTPIFN